MTPQPTEPHIDNFVLVDGEEEIDVPFVNHGSYSLPIGQAPAEIVAIGENLRRLNLTLKRYADIITPSSVSDTQVVWNIGNQDGVYQLWEPSRLLFEFYFGDE